MKLTEIKVNPKNPRQIRDHKFKQLVQSLKDFPEMMELRPIIIDEAGIIQAGNMRFRALQELNYKEIPDSWVKQGKDLTPEQWKEFLIKDNSNFGNWDFDELANNFDIEQLSEWGVDIPDFKIYADEESPNEETKETIKNNSAICPNCGHEFECKKPKK